MLATLYTFVKYIYLVGEWDGGIRWGQDKADRRGLAEAVRVWCCIIGVGRAVVESQRGSMDCQPGKTYPENLLFVFEI